MSKVLADLERDLVAVRNDEALAPAALAEKVAGIERQLRDFAIRLGKVDPAGAGAAALEDLQEWKDRCDAGNLESSAERAGELQRRYFEDSALRWRESLKPLIEESENPEAAACFYGLMHTTALQLEARGEFPGEGVGNETFEAVREELRTAMVRNVEVFPVDELEHRHWVRELCDRADMLLTAIDNLAPQRAANQLRLIENDIKWHLDHISRKWGRPRRRLKRKLKQVQAERQERRLQAKLEKKFGTKTVAFVERLVLILIFVVVILLTIEFSVDLSYETQFWFAVIDASCCVVFLVEFFTKLAYVEGRWFWFKRHWLIDLVPSIPITLMTLGMDPTRYGRAARLARLPRLTRYLRLLRPVIRILRAVGLLARGLDRLARQFGHVLNQNVILYPTREELDRAYAESSLRQSQIWKLQEDIRDTWLQLLKRTEGDTRSEIASMRLDVLHATLMVAVNEGTVTTDTTARQVKEVPAEILINRMLSMTPLEVEAALDERLIKQISRLVRIFSRWPLRWFPVVRGFMPRTSEEMTRAEVVAAASRKAGRVFQKWHERWFWFSDLHGTVTPSQFVDRVGTMIFKSSFRPAYRLLMFGAILGFINLMLQWSNSGFLSWLNEKIQPLFEPVVLIGGVCVLFLILGWYLQRIAKEATEFFERSAQAQFLALTEVIRSRNLHRDLAVLYDRVLQPDWTSRDPRPRGIHMKHFVDRAEARFTGSGGTETFQGLETTLLLYHDWLDGAMFTESDTRTTSQLLGNPAIRQLVSLSARITRREENALQTLDLVRQKALFGGPYIWFNFVSRAIAHSVARLIVDYNQKAVPLAELELVREEQRRIYDEWLGETADTSVDQVDGKRGKPSDQSYITTAFTALHFLDIDERRDDDVRNRFGESVLTKLKRDRSVMIRRIFGTLPRHIRPKDERVVNLYTFYQNWLARGRALWLPLTALIAMFRGIGRLFAWIWRAYKELRNPQLRAERGDAADAHYRTAVRKIGRIRWPIVEASLRLRIIADPEFLNVPLPGERRSPLDGADVETDLSFLHPDPSMWEHVEHQRERAEADVQRLERMIGDGLLERLALKHGLHAKAFTTPEHIRAATIAYCADFNDARIQMSSMAVLNEVQDWASREAMLPHPGGWWKPRLRYRFNRYWKEHGTGKRRMKKAMWRAVLNDVWGAKPALVEWAKHNSERVEDGEERLGDLLLHPGRISEQLLAIRAIQTLAVLDILNYREHVYRLGQYADGGETAGDLLRWETVHEAEAEDTPAGATN